ncbi:MAG TPA: adenylate/guanylate cyclase domain-containing protein [Terriglobales bacterium]|nr:adenylate/guanylate cyclase domain-containing protein [Terriglobales bacterium]
MTCPRCQAKGRDGIRFCESCGASLAAICRQCGAAVTPGAGFCGACGTSLAAARPDRFASPGSYTPQHLAERILTSRSALEGERKQVTVLFCDLANSTPLAELLGPEAMYGLLNGFFELALGEVHRYEGTINQFLGDGFMALFGAPLAREDHARRAVLTALGIQRALRERLADVARRGGEELDVRMGINTGLVVVGKIGDNLRMDYTAVSDTTHVASRLEQLAEPGNILISEATYRLVRGYARVEDLGELSVRGKSDRIRAYKVLGPGSRRSRLEGQEPQTLTRFVGRERELTTLMSLLAKAEAGDGQIVGIVGESGVGKSRLFHEFRQRLANSSLTYLEGRCLSYGSSIPYLPVLDVLRQNCGITETDGPEAIAQKIEWGLREVDMDPAETSPYLLHLLGIKEGTARLAALSPKVIQVRSFDALRQMTFKGSRRRPLVILVEDLQWIDKTSEEYAASLAENIAGSRVLLVLTYRSGYQLPWMEKSYSTQLALHHLTPKESLEVVQAVLAPRGATDAVRRFILAKAEGNPLFLEELARAAADRRALETGSPLPETIHDVLSARIDGLGDGLKRLLQDAAVLGREVSLRLLEATVEQPEGLEEALRELTRQEFLYERTGASERMYVFKHALTQDVAYASLLERRRQAAHLRVGQALESLYANRIDEVVELLAHHFGRTAEAEKAVDYAILAAEKAQRRWANSEALAHFDRALSRLAAMPDTPANALRRIDAVIKQGEIRFALGRHTEQLVLLEGIRRLVEESADPPRLAAWHYWTGFLHSLTGGRPEIAIAHCLEAVGVAENTGLLELCAFAESCLTQVYVMAGELHRAMDVGERSLRTFEALGNRWWACRTLSHLAAAANARGEWDLALRYCQRALEYGLAVDDLRLKVSALVRMGSTHVQRGDTSACLRRCEEAQALSPTPYDAAAVRAIRAYGLVKQGHLAEGVTELEDVLAWYARSQLRFTRSQFALWLADAHLRRGDAGRARRLAEDVLTTSREVGYGQLEGVAHRLLAECLLESERALAAEHLEQALQILERIGARNEVAKIWVAQAAVQRGRGDAPAARELLDRALARFEQLSTLDERARVSEALAILAAGSPA